jgi:hypothetical protein
LSKKFQKKIQNFGKDFSVKSREKTKLKKNKKSNFFQKKKIICVFCFQFVFFHGKQTNWTQNWQKVAKICVYVPFIIFFEKKKYNLKILKCVKVNTDILATFSSCFVTYDSNFLRCHLLSRFFQNEKKKTLLYEGERFFLNLVFIGK